MTGRSGSAASTSLADTRSPVVTGEPSSTAATSGPTSMPPKQRCAVSAVDLRSRCSSTACSRPSSPDSNSSLPRSTSITVPRSTTLATGILFAEDGGAVSRRCGHRLGGGDREPRRHPRALVDRPRLAQVAGETGEDLHQVDGHFGGEVGLLVDDAHLGVELQRVMRADLGAEAVLQRRDDAAAVRVVLRVGAGHDEHIQRQPQRVAADLDVALLHHIQHRDLDPLGQVGQLVDRDDAAVGPRNQAVGDGLGVAEAAALGDLDRVDVADQVRDAGVGGGQFLGVALTAVLPGHREVVAQFRALRMEPGVIGL